MIDKLWKYAEQVSDAQDKNGDVNIKSIKRFVSPLLFTGRDVPVYAWLTIKETERDGSRIYSIELGKIETLECRLKTVCSFLFKRFFRCCSKAGAEIEQHFQSGGRERRTLGGVSWERAVVSGVQ